MKIDKVKKQRAFLKWAGGKYNLVESIIDLLPKRSDTLVEPFVGAGSVFLNSDYKKYILNDINPDLINLYRHLKAQPEALIGDCAKLYQSQYNTEDAFYAIREEFNQEADSYRRSVLFTYLNRHGYNGLCRYNLSGKFNVPFGRYVKPYFPEHEMYFFARKAQKAEFTLLDFEESMRSAPLNAVIYCDPPYVSLSETAKFTQYSGAGFNHNDQQRLASTANELSIEGRNTVLISNHDTPFSRTLYQHARIKSTKVARVISQNVNNRRAVKEVLALYKANKIKHKPTNSQPSEQ
ncbi:Dam family site-specific DNA-(adenine-N6)-methyltransferase [Catenovulum sediminis]|uniref:Site-specific DNA-methyltransferase (adenine-specific) n=1 Tax=Catenovulum sediminis TaxID=1740262 RepID=A0ABV1RMW5_9ALTE|nr:Dam family site-specific DNA-(adenine-N6)-methyltransferase [Catenovulum sediminis]